MNAVTIHNKTLANRLDEICEEYDKADADIYRQSETMQSGDYTATGFSVDVGRNKTVSYSVTKNGAAVAIPSDHTFTSTGKYEINMKSAVGTTRKVTIYVDSMSSEESLKFYFGDAFVTGKRIYSDGEYAVFEGGKSSYQMQAVDINHLPLGGQIKNTTTGEVIDISANRSAKNAKLTSPGKYEAVLSTKANGFTSGDNRVFTFNFVIIAEGTAPGPVVNRRSLEEYARSTVSDSKPTFYALTYPSAATGNITLAFATEKAAADYAYSYDTWLQLCGFTKAGDTSIGKCCPYISSGAT